MTPRPSKRCGVWAALATGTALSAAGCAHPAPSAQVLPPLPASTGISGTATPRINGNVSSSLAEPQVAVSSVPGLALSQRAGSAGGGAGDVSLDFADTDIREVAAQILGNTLHVNYTIDPAVHGTATLRTVTPLANSQLVPVLQSLLAQNGATLVQSAGVYRVLPTASAAGIAGGAGTAGGMMVPLRYASAEDLAKVLAPYVQAGGKLVAVPSSNALVIAGEPAQRDALASLIQSFDVDVLAGQSYALFPVASGSAEDFAAAFQQAFRAQKGDALASQIRVVPLPRVDAVLVVTNAPAYLTQARRVYAVVERGMRQTMRTWHVYYIQNSTANDTAYILQQAFTPNNVTAQPTAHGQGQQSQTQSGIASQLSAGSSGDSGGSGSSSTLGGGLGGSTTGATSSGGLGSAGGLGGQGHPSTVSSSSSAANPLLGGLSNSGGSSSDTNTMRIIPNPENNAILVYATGEEESIVEAMLHKIDILPLQVRIDAIIAEVTLTDELNYGTEFYFKHHGINGALAQAASTIIGGAPSGVTGGSGFVFNAAGKDGDVVLNALQNITTVKVLSSPELLVLDNETASLQVGNLVPYLTGTTTNLASTNAITNSINYQKTGVITQVTPRVNSGGLVTLDISQEVSGISTASGTTSGAGSTINSPTFTERAVQSRVVIQDGQTIGLAGLITDNVQRGNSGIPFLKDIPVLSFIAGTQSNVRTRTELLVLLTPHVLHDQRDARQLTEDLREQLPRAAIMPYELQNLRQSGSDNPAAKWLGGGSK